MKKLTKSAFSSYLISNIVLGFERLEKVEGPMLGGGDVKKATVDEPPIVIESVILVVAVGPVHTVLLVEVPVAMSFTARNCNTLKTDAKFFHDRLGKELVQNFSSFKIKVIPLVEPQRIFHEGTSRNYKEN